MTEYAQLKLETALHKTDDSDYTEHKNLFYSLLLKSISKFDFEENHDSLVYDDQPMLLGFTDSPA